MIFASKKNSEVYECSMSVNAERIYVPWTLLNFCAGQLDPIILGCKIELQTNNAAFSGARGWFKSSHSKCKCSSFFKICIEGTCIYKNTCIYNPRIENKWWVGDVTWSKCHDTRSRVKKKGNDIVIKVMMQGV